MSSIYYLYDVLFQSFKPIRCLVLEGISQNWLRHNVKMYVMTSKVRYDVKIHHEDKTFILPSKTCHDANTFAMMSTTRCHNARINTL